LVRSWAVLRSGEGNVSRAESLLGARAAQFGQQPCKRLEPGARLDTQVGELALGNGVRRSIWNRVGASVSTVPRPASAMVFSIWRSRLMRTFAAPMACRPASISANPHAAFLLRRD